MAKKVILKKLSATYTVYLPTSVACEKKKKKSDGMPYCDSVNITTTNFQYQIFFFQTLKENNSFGA